ncbi:MAG TPA: hypothetical protein VIK82_00105 [Porticoccaceae bacterium]
MNVQDVLEYRLKAADRLHALGAITDEEREQLYREAYNEARKQLGLPSMPDDWRPPVPPKMVVLPVESMPWWRRLLWRWL